MVWVAAAFFGVGVCSGICVGVGNDRGGPSAPIYLCLGFGAALMGVAGILSEMLS